MRASLQGLSTRPLHPSTQKTGTERDLHGSLGVGVGDKDGAVTLGFWEAQQGQVSMLHMSPRHWL